MKKAREDARGARKTDRGPGKSSVYNISPNSRLGSHPKLTETTLRNIDRQRGRLDTLKGVFYNNTREHGGECQLRAHLRTLATGRTRRERDHA